MPKSDIGDEGGCVARHPVHGRNGNGGRLMRQCSILVPFGLHTPIAFSYLHRRKAWPRCMRKDDPPEIEMALVFHRRAHS